RLAFALCISAVAHGWLLSGLREAPHLPFSRESRIEARIDARVTGQGADRIDIAPSAMPAEMPAERSVSASAAAATGRGLEPNRRALAPVDSNWYTAHELDSYPRALGPIRIAYPMALGEARVAARVLLWLRIDEHGEVFDVRAGEADTPERLIEAARAGIAA